MRCRDTEGVAEGVNVSVQKCSAGRQHVAPSRCNGSMFKRDAAGTPGAAVLRSPDARVHSRAS